MRARAERTADYAGTAALAALLAAMLGWCSGCATLRGAADGAAEELSAARIDVGAILDSSDPARAGLAAGLALLARVAIGAVRGAFRGSTSSPSSPAPSSSSSPAPSSPPNPPEEAPIAAPAPGPIADPAPEPRPPLPAPPQQRRPR